MEFLYFLLLLIAGIISVVAIVISVVFIYLTVNAGFMNTSPSVPSSGKVRDALISDVAARLEKSTESLTVMDLGSGWGTLLLPLAHRFPQHKFVGIEYSRLPYAVSCLRARKLANMRFLRQDFFKTDISSADIIFLFLLPSTMQKLADKCHNELTKGTLIYDNRFKLPSTEPAQTISLGSDYYTYYIYEM